MTMKKAEEKKLIDIIGSHGWQLIDVSDNPEGWDEINKREPANNLSGFPKQYLFVPKPFNGQTYKDSYAVATEKHLKPSLMVDGDVKSYEGWISMDVYQKPHIFSRLFIVDEKAIAAAVPDFDSFVVMKAENAVEIFEKYFSIADYQKTENLNRQLP